jgi:predicted ATP-dependent endonuclease of OLD family
MINIPTTINIPELWGTQQFVKNDWGPINIIVGPNGVGKSLLTEKIRGVMQQNNFKPRLLNAERLSGFEKQNYIYYGASSLDQGLNISQFDGLKTQGNNFGLSASAFIILKERLDVKIKIEALLSDIFQKTIRLAEEEGFLKPKIQNNTGGAEYGLKERECHGLKELITLLTFLYENEHDCIIFDEPELHLHPQFQAFLLKEIRDFAGNPKIDPEKKIIFIITHSPYFLDLRTIDDLKNVIVCHYNKLPSFIDGLEPQDEYILKKFLPRFNTHQKQFFFSPNPVFVEGYTDQQIISLLFDKLDYNISASGSCVIDVGGKDELAVFYRICKKLKITAKIIADIDAFFRGKLREVVQSDDDSKQYVSENALGTDLSRLIGELGGKIKTAANNIISTPTSDPDIQYIIEYLTPIISNPDKRDDVIISMLLFLLRFI